jgi:uncharacterized protein (DUF1697 family)
MSLVVFLRGINVGGHKTLRPRDLAEQLRQYDVVNIGAAGTFVVRKPVVQAQLRDQLRRLLPFDAHVMMCSGRELVRATSHDPFVGERARTDVVRFMSVLARPPRAAPAMPLRLPRDGRWCLRVLATEGRFVFGVYRREMRAIGFLGKLDELFGAPATTRSWSTIATVRRHLDSGAMA